MRKLLYCLLLGSFALLNMQCAEETYEGLKIKGKIEGAENLQIFFDQISLTNKLNIKGKSDAGSNGKFEIHVEDMEPGIYRLRIGAKGAMIVLNGNEKLIEIDGDLATLDKNGFRIKGAKEANIYKSFVGENTRGKLNETEVKNFLDTTNSVMSSMFLALTQLNPKTDMKYVENVKTKLTNAYPNSTYIKDYDVVVNQIKQQLATAQIKVGEQAPDIELPSPDGTVYKLSDLKGKVVLIDFWASWCKPCRYNNPKLVSIYSKYKDQGFTIYSVSLDRPGQTERWKKAIKEDNLTWPYHVSDLQFWQSAPAKQYGVRGIPRTFLLDKEGRFAAINPNSRLLEQELKKLL